MIRSRRSNLFYSYTKNKRIPFRKFHILCGYVKMWHSTSTHEKIENCEEATVVFLFHFDIVPQLYREESDNTYKKYRADNNSTKRQRLQRKPFWSNTLKKIFSCLRFFFSKSRKGNFLIVFK
jgi:hypothetical protein